MFQESFCTVKAAVNKGLEMDLEHALEYEAECFEAAVKTEDAREGLQAFLEKRKLEFKGQMNVNEIIGDLKES